MSKSLSECDRMQGLGNVMFHGLLAVAVHQAVFIVGIESVEGSANGS